MLSSSLFHSSSGYTNRHCSKPRVITNVSFASLETYLRSLAGMLTRPLLSAEYAYDPLKDDTVISVRSGTPENGVVVRVRHVTRWEDRDGSHRLPTFTHTRNLR